MDKEPTKKKSAQYWLPPDVISWIKTRAIVEGGPPCRLVERIFRREMERLKRTDRAKGRGGEIG